MDGRITEAVLYITQQRIKVSLSLLPFFRALTWSESVQYTQFFNGLWLEAGGALFRRFPPANPKVFPRPMCMGLSYMLDSHKSPIRASVLILCWVFFVCCVMYIFFSFAMIYLLYFVIASKWTLSTFQKLLLSACHHTRWCRLNRVTVLPEPLKRRHVLWCVSRLTCDSHLRLQRMPTICAIVTLVAVRWIS